jgi:predicted PurR-regulated permease PerM
MSVASQDDRERRALKWLAIGLVFASVVMLWPFAPWVILAMWTAVFARRVHGPLTRRFGNRPRIAAVVTIAMLALVMTPILILLTFLVADAIDLVQRLMATERVQELLQRLVANDAGEPRPSFDLASFVLSQSERAWAIGQQIAGTAVRAVIGVVILIAGTYAILVDGERWYGWIERHAPISAPALRRLANAFVETGRGLLVGVVGAGLAQSIVATIVYIALGVPQPFALGFLTLVFSVVPAIGTASVWLPVAAGLALTGRTGAAGLLVIAGFALIGTIDNVVRPYLARRGSLQLPTYVVLVAMFGGIVIMGTWGVLLAPLIVRLAKESLSLLRDTRVSTG